MLDPPIEAPASRLARVWTRADALVEFVRGRLTITGPATADAIAVTLGVTSVDVDAALLTLEADGVAMRGRFTEAASSVAQGSSPAVVEWCDRTLLARIHRYTLNRLRAEIEPVSQAGFMRFLFAWQHVDASHRLAGVDGVRAIIEQLDGVEVAAEAWERSVLPSRVDGYEPALLDMLCLTGEVGWLRRTASESAELAGATPIALFMRSGDASLKASVTDAARATGAATSESVAPGFSPAAARVLATLRDRGPSFAHELARGCGLTDEEIKLALGRLAAAGLATSDGFGGLRWLLRGSSHRSPRTQLAGRWSAVARKADGDDASAVDACARTL
ncbi:MAG TPA: ATP-dependent DNA helicase, partial [Caldimonas sp.]|nr:ATP-dependent DNA helicase [Caldimonas sp.]